MISIALDPVWEWNILAPFSSRLLINMIGQRRAKCMSIKWTMPMPLRFATSATAVAQWCRDSFELPRPTLLLCGYSCHPQQFCLKKSELFEFSGSLESDLLLTKMLYVPLLSLQQRGLNKTRLNKRGPACDKFYHLSLWINCNMSQRPGHYGLSWERSCKCSTVDANSSPLFTT